MIVFLCVSYFKETYMETVRLSQVNQALISSVSKVQKEQSKVLEQKKNGKKLLAFGALAVSAFAVAGLAIYKGKTKKLSDINFNKGIATLRKNNQNFSGKIKTKLMNGDKTILEYSDGILNKSIRTGEKNISKTFSVNEQGEKIVEIVKDGKTETKNISATIEIVKKEQAKLKELLSDKQLSSDEFENEVGKLKYINKKQKAEIAEALKRKRLKEKELKEYVEAEIKRRNLEAENVDKYQAQISNLFEAKLSNKSARESFLNILESKGFKIEDTDLANDFLKNSDNASFSGTIVKKLPNGDLSKLKYENGIMQQSSREGSVNFVKKYVYDDNSGYILKVIKESTEGVKETNYEYFGNGKLKFVNSYEEFNDGEQDVSIRTIKFPDGSEKIWRKRSRYSKFPQFRNKLPNGYQFACGHKLGIFEVEETLPDGTWIRWMREYKDSRMQYPKRAVRFELAEEFLGEEAYFSKIHEKHPNGSEKEWYAGKLVYEKFPNGSVREWYFDGMPKSGKFDDGSVFVYKDGASVGKLPDGREIRIEDVLGDGSWAYKSYEKLPDGTISTWDEGQELIRKTLPYDAEKRFTEEEAIKRARKIQDEYFEALKIPKKSAKESAETILDIKQQEVANEVQGRIAQQKAIGLAQAREDEYFADLRASKKSARESFYAIQKLKAQQAQDFYNKPFEDKLSHKSAKESAEWIEYLKQKEIDDYFRMPRNRGFDDKKLPFSPDDRKEVPGHKVYINSKIPAWYFEYLRLCKKYGMRAESLNTLDEAPKIYEILKAREENEILYSHTFEHFFNNIVHSEPSCSYSAPVHTIHV